MADIVELKFANSDAKPKFETINIARKDVPKVMAWYGAYFARDRYRVTVDGEVVPKNQNGEMKERSDG